MARRGGGGRSARAGTPRLGQRQRPLRAAAAALHHGTARLQSKSLTRARQRGHTATGPSGEHRAPETGQRRRSALRALPGRGNSGDSPPGVLNLAPREHGSFASWGSLAPDSPGPNTTSLSSPSCCRVPRPGGSYPLVSHSNGQPSFSPYQPVFGAGTNPNPPFLARHPELKDSPDMSTWNPFGPLLFPEQGGQTVIPSNVPRSTAFSTQNTFIS